MLICADNKATEQEIAANIYQWRNTVTVLSSHLHYNLFLIILGHVLNFSWTLQLMSPIICNSDTKIPHVVRFRWISYFTHLFMHLLHFYGKHSRSLLPLERITVYFTLLNSVSFTRVFITSHKLYVLHTHITVIDDGTCKEIIKDLDSLTTAISSWLEITSEELITK